MFDDLGGLGGLFFDDYRGVHEDDYCSRDARIMCDEYRGFRRIVICLTASWLRLICSASDELLCLLSFLHFMYPFSRNLSARVPIYRIVH